MYTGVPKLSLDIRAMLLLENVIQQNELRPFTIKNTRIREKHQNAGFSSNFVNETIHNFKNETEETIKPE